MLNRSYVCFRKPNSIHLITVCVLFETGFRKMTFVFLEQAYLDFSSKNKISLNDTPSSFALALGWIKMHIMGEHVFFFSTELHLAVVSYLKGCRV